MERGKLRPGDDTDDDVIDDREWCDALTVAAAMSVSPQDLTPRIAIRGNGVLALTAHGRAHGTPKGALPI